MVARMVNGGSVTVYWETPSPPRDGLSIGRAIASAVVFLANDKEDHLRGQVIRIPSGVTT